MQGHARTMSWAWGGFSLSFSCPRRAEASVSSIVGGSSFSSEIAPTDTWPSLQQNHSGKPFSFRPWPLLVHTCAYCIPPLNPDVPGPYSASPAFLLYSFSSSCASSLCIGTLGKSILGATSCTFVSCGLILNLRCRAPCEALQKLPVIGRRVATRNMLVCGNDQIGLTKTKKT